MVFWAVVAIFMPFAKANNWQGENVEAETEFEPNDLKADVWNGPMN